LLGITATHTFTPRETIKRINRGALRWLQS
jgi:hypothetical protein